MTRTDALEAVATQAAKRKHFSKILGDHTFKGGEAPGACILCDALNLLSAAEPDPVVAQFCKTHGKQVVGRQGAHIWIAPDMGGHPGCELVPLGEMKRA